MKKPKKPKASATTKQWETYDKKIQEFNKKEKKRDSLKKKYS